MAKAPPRASVPGPAFIRLLARLTDADIPASRHPLSDRLSQWIDWNRAIALSRALDGRLPVAEAGADAPGFDSAEEDECARARAALADAIAAGPQPSGPGQRGGTHLPAGEGAAEPTIDSSGFRQHYLSMQRAMLTATGRLRGRLRDLLARESADMARLAELDAVMEMTLSPREQRLLAAVPGLLEAHFDRLREAAQGAPADAPVAEPSPAWLETFRRDMRSVLLAELDFRFQPIEGLLAALRTR